MWIHEIKKLESRKEFLGKSLEGRLQELEWGEYLCCSADGKYTTVLLPIIVRLQSPVPDQSQILSVLTGSTCSEANNSPPFDSMLNHNQVDTDDIQEYFRILASISVLLGRLSITSLERLLDAGLVDTFSWDLNELVYLHGRNTDEPST